MSYGLIEYLGIIRNTIVTQCTTTIYIYLYIITISARMHVIAWNCPGTWNRFHVTAPNSNFRPVSVRTGRKLITNYPLNRDTHGSNNSSWNAGFHLLGVIIVWQLVRRASVGLSDCWCSHLHDTNDRGNTRSPALF